MFRVLVDFGDVSIEFSRVGDHWLIVILAQLSYSEADLMRLNRVRVHQQVIFLSCILGASGKTLDNRYLEQRPVGDYGPDLTSLLRIRPEKPFCLWEEALWQIVPIEGVMDRLGSFNHEGYKIWPWRYDALLENL